MLRWLVHNSPSQVPEPQRIRSSVGRSHLTAKSPTQRYYAWLQRLQPAQLWVGLTALPLLIAGCTTLAGVSASQNRAAPGRATSQLGLQAVAADLSRSNCQHTTVLASAASPQTFESSSATAPLRFGASIVPAPPGPQFGIGVGGSNNIPMALHPEHARLKLEDFEGKQIPGIHRFRFDSCVPYPYLIGGAAQTRPQLPDFWIGFHLDTSRLPAGMYRISATLGPGFATARDGTPLRIDPRLGSLSLTVYISPMPDRPPGLTRGQQFIVLTTPLTTLGEGGTFVDGNGASIPASRIEARVLTLKRVEAGRIQFQDEDGMLLYVPRVSDAMSIPDLYPLVVDSTVRVLRTEYVGRQVWGYGGMSVIGRGWRAGTRGGLPIAAIYLAYGYAPMLDIGASVSQDRLPSSFVALNPLIVRFGLPQNANALPVYSPLSHDVLGYSIRSDAWDFVRSYSLVSMTQAHPDWSRTTISEVQQGKIALGMTKDMIAWASGYPSVYGTIEQVQRLDTWHYTCSAPFSSTVYFHNGVVVRYDPRGRLP